MTITMKNPRAKNERGFLGSNYEVLFLSHSLPFYVGWLHSSCLEPETFFTVYAAWLDAVIAKT